MRTTRTLRRTGAAMLLAAVVTACAREAETGDTMANTDSAAALPPAGGSQAASPGAPMNDAQVAAVGAAANADEIRTSQALLQGGDDAAAPVREFAQRMIDEHTRVQQAMDQLLQQKGITPEEGPVSQEMRALTERTTQQLGATQSRQRDSLYMAHQVIAHGRTLELLDQSLPNVTDPDLRRMLETQVRPAVQQHLQQAQQLVESMTSAGGGTASRPGNSPTGDSGGNTGTGTSSGTGTATGGGAPPAMPNTPAPQRP